MKRSDEEFPMSASALSETPRGGERRSGPLFWRALFLAIDAESIQRVCGPWCDADVFGFSQTLVMHICFI